MIIIKNIMVEICVLVNINKMNTPNSSVLTCFINNGYTFVQ